MLDGSALNRPALCEVYAESWLALRNAFQHCKYETMDQTGCIHTAEFRNSCKLHPLSFYEVFLYQFINIILRMVVISRL